LGIEGEHLKTYEGVSFGEVGIFESLSWEQAFVQAALWVMNNDSTTARVLQHIEVHATYYDDYEIIRIGEVLD
jgi:hypothetical protein